LAATRRLEVQVVLAADSLVLAAATVAMAATTLPATQALAAAAREDTRAMAVTARLIRLTTPQPVPAAAAVVVVSQTFRATSRAVVVVVWAFLGKVPAVRQETHLLETLTAVMAGQVVATVELLAIHTADRLAAALAA
jgi:hypothetical protein